MALQPMRKWREAWHAGAGMCRAPIRGSSNGQQRAQMRASASSHRPARQLTCTGASRETSAASWRGGPPLASAGPALQQGAGTTHTNCSMGRDQCISGNGWQRDGEELISHECSHVSLPARQPHLVPHGQYCNRLTIAWGWAHEQEHIQHTAGHAPAAARRQRSGAEAGELLRASLYCQPFSTRLISSCRSSYAPTAQAHLSRSSVGTTSMAFELRSSMPHAEPSAGRAAEHACSGAAACTRHAAIARHVSA